MADHRTKETLSKNAHPQDGVSRRWSIETLGEGNRTDQGTLREKHGDGGSSPSLRTKPFPATHCPEHLTRIMCEIMGIQKHQSVLEPSAGRGGMVKVIEEFTKNIFAFELNAGSYSELYRNTKRTTNVFHADFLTVSPQDFGMFDHVLMCPPKDSLRHIQHAREFLMPGGKLMALIQDQNVEPFLSRTCKRFPLHEEEFEFNGKLIPCSILAWGV